MSTSSLSKAPFIKGSNVFPPDLAKSRRRELLIQSYATALIIDKRLERAITETPVKFHSNMIIITSKWIRGFKIWGYLAAPPL